jgi:hypothetical protein
LGSVIIGTNKLINCRTLIGVKDQPLLQVEFLPLRVSLVPPRNLPSGISFEIIDNITKGMEGRANQDLRIVAGETNVSILWKDFLLLSATLLDKETAHLKLDLRPIGIKIFDDPEGLHVGSNLLANGSILNCMTAISLG